MRGEIMEKTFKVVSCADALQDNYPDADDYFDEDYSRWALYEFDENDKPVRLVGTDGGEPEDQLLVRDWRWVEKELNKERDKVNYYREQLMLCKQEIDAIMAVKKEFKISGATGIQSIREYILNLRALLGYYEEM